MSSQPAAGTGAPPDGQSGSCCAVSRHSAPPVSVPPGEHVRAANPSRSPALDIGPAQEVADLPGGTFWMGSDDPDVNPLDGEGPVRRVSVRPFAIGRHAVTNREFSAFVAETGHVTTAERFGWSFVFAAFLPGRVRARSPRPDEAPWWCAVEGASWSAPRGPGSVLADIWDHPVVHVSWEDAETYAAWAGGRLPMETEWEYAARGGLERARYPWGDELTPAGEHRCNIWQGQFPARNTADDGYRGTAPVDAYAPNGYGLYDTAGNVWEMCADVWTTGDLASAAPDPGRRVMRGGSYLCHDSYCNRYRVAARTSNTVDSTSGNLGFRLAFDR